MHTIKFYAVPLPNSVAKQLAPGGEVVTKLVGYDGKGEIVACLILPSSRGTPLSACA
jgi:hypothetical protein